MPTGYTACVQDGTVTDFSEFAIKCARAFGACIMQRDDPADDPIKLDEPAAYYDESIKKDEAKLKKLESLSNQQLTYEWNKYILDKQTEIEEGLAKKELEKSRYEGMLEKVREWEPPTTDHTKFKTFMTDQLIESISFDCGGEYYEKMADEFEKMTREAWLYDQKRSVKRRIAYCTKTKGEELERVNSRNDWKIALFESLGKELI